MPVASRAMPRLPWVLLLAFVHCTPPAARADQPQEQLTTQYTTTVQGTVPDLTGRWLVVGYVGLQGKEKEASVPDQPRLEHHAGRWQAERRTALRGPAAGSE